MKLRRQKPRVIWNLDDLGQAIVRIAREHEPVRFKAFAIGIVELVAVPMALGDVRLAVDAAYSSPFKPLNNF